MTVIDGEGKGERLDVWESAKALDVVQRAGSSIHLRSNRESTEVGVLRDGIDDARKEVDWPLPGVDGEMREIDEWFEVVGAQCEAFGIEVKGVKGGVRGASHEVEDAGVVHGRVAERNDLKSRELKRVF